MLRFVTAGESHGQALIAWISGLPAGVPVDLDFIGRELHRRQLGYGRGGRQRIEKDQADILAGVRHGKTIGAPIALRLENRDWKNWEHALPVEDSEGAEDAQRRLTAPCPGRGAVSRRCASSAPSESSTGSACSQFFQSRFSRRSAMGAPMVFPWRTPASMSA